MCPIKSCYNLGEKNLKWLKTHKWDFHCSIFLNLKTFFISLLIHKPGQSCRWNLKLAPIQGGQGEMKKTEHFRLVDGSINKQGNLHRRLVLGDSKMSRSLNLPTRISKVRGLNWAQSHILFRQSQQYSTLKAASLKTIPTAGKKWILRIGGRELPVTWVQIKNQWVLTSSRW